MDGLADVGCFLVITGEDNLFSWKDITWEAPFKSGRGASSTKEIIHGVSGAVHSSEIMMIVGESTIHHSLNMRLLYSSIPLMTLILV